MTENIDPTPRRNNQHHSPSGEWDAVRDGLRDIRSDQRDIRNEIRSIRTDTAEISISVSTLTERVAGMGREVQSITSLNDRIVALEAVDRSTRKTERKANAGFWSGVVGVALGIAAAVKEVITYLQSTGR
jgi:chromosome segregation ATPase